MHSCVVAAMALVATAAAAAETGDAARGAAIAASRTQGQCVLCHAVPGVPAVLSGNIGPSLAGAGARWSAAELRQRLVTPERFNPDSVMPSVSRTDGLVQVASARRGQPILDARQVDDVVAYLVTLR